MITPELGALLFLRLTKFFFIWAATLALASILSKKMGRERLLGVTILATLILTSGIYDFLKYTDWSFYHEQGKYQFQGWLNAEFMIQLRYVYSILWRMAMIAMGVFLLLLRPQARKAVIWLAWIQILTIYWKHPREVFRHLALEIQQKSAPHTTELLYPWQPWAGVIFFSLLDLIPAVIIIYYFNRLAVKKNFES